MTEKREIIAVPNSTGLPFSTVVGFDKLIFVSGMVGRHPETGQIAAAYIAFFTSGLPARSCVQVTALPDPVALVEIEVIADR